MASSFLTVRNTISTYLSGFLYPATRLLATQTKNMASNTSQPADSEKPSLEKNPYFNKYAAKIAALQNASPDVFSERVDSLSRQKQPQKGEATASAIPEPSSKGKVESAGSYTFSKVKQLSSIMKTELLADKTPEEITKIWHEYFQHKDVISAVLTKDMHQAVNERVLRHPTFLFPLPRDQGYEFMLCQFAGNEAHFTSLINYQTYKENAPECLIVVYYPDIAEEKNVVLVKGDYNKDLLTSREAQCLVNQIQLYYGSPNDAKQALMTKFTEDPQNFQYMDLIREFESITM